MSIDIIKYCLEKCKEDQKELEVDLNIALRSPVFESFEGSDSQEVCDYSIEISEKDIKNWELKDPFLDWVILELNGNIINSKTNKMIFNNRRMIFYANRNEFANDNERFYFLGFDKFVLR